jgi:hypothetical protein
VVRGTDVDARLLCINTTDAFRRARGARGSGQGGTPFRAKYEPNLDMGPIRSLLC